MTIEEFTAVISTAARVELDDPQTSFTAQGLDSLGLLNVLVAVEDSYSIEIDPGGDACLRRERGHDSCGMSASP